eukprot:COSAG04_NODE_19565_length_413_cov_0.824841_2_plen_20_part_01
MIIEIVSLAGHHLRGSFGLA